MQNNRGPIDYMCYAVDEDLNATQTLQYVSAQLFERSYTLEIPQLFRQASIAKE